ncbi:taurine transporter ATP-binding subunit [Antarctobacter heliothermus]|uniref:Taurine transporter ATP-binding subunit n=1 Tax=Antarctobacter heliothermus TaxID=74033 RepID=A0A222E2E4_9RHOB|nr:ABC transporter ATP-binding protein [Antarctobacter heliothermus]ASP20399.1 taurine transporter ATP-binding subunit [Antarctobacter heliothermus]
MDGSFQVSDAATPYVQINAVGKVYASPRGDVVALEDINLDIRPGEFVSIVGPSGCGKSTLFKCLAGLEPVTSGAMHVAGGPLSGPPESLGMVFQRDVLLDWRTILDNVLLQAEFRNLPKAKYRDRAAQLLQRFGLGGFEKMYPWELSGGMRQRASICRALLCDPDMLLMDEPFGALDAMTRDDLNLELTRIWQGSEKTVLFITHSIAEAVYLSDRVVMMSRSPGEIVDVIDIDLPRPRPLSIRETPEFGAYTQKIRHHFAELGILKE